MDFDIKECCEALRVSRSGYYRWRRGEPSRREKENAELVEQIKEVFEANKSRYGSPRVTRELRQRGLKCGQNRIARLMRAGSRLVNLSSSGHRYANVDLDDPNFERTSYEPFVAYGRSKTANILFAVAFDERHRERGVRAAAVHPGGIQTELGRHLDPARIEAIIKQMNNQLAAEGKAPFQWKTIPQGAATSVWAGVVAPADAVGGKYCENCHVGRVVPDDVSISAISEGVRGYALDSTTAAALWKKSEEMVGESF